MDDNIDNIVLEHLRAIRKSQSEVIDEIRDLKTRVNQIEFRMSTSEKGIIAIHDAMAHHSLKLDRIDDRIRGIEKRLDLVDA